MGLIKTGLTLAGGYGLLKAASKAVNEYEDKKQKRSSQPEHQYQQHNYLGHEPHMNYMPASQANHHSFQPQWQSHHEPRGGYQDFSIRGEGQNQNTTRISRQCGQLATRDTEFCSKYWIISVCPIPEDVCIFTTLHEAAKIQTADPYTIFYPENNGHYAKNSDRAVVTVALDGMCEEIDHRNTELEAKIATGEKLTDEYAV
ncbi:hypothetical protein BDV27DRAFT_156126 [Aspergillus caelatus]|uniref:Uncharacterized protein n=1 Tax=Aspergillus caelatus TaxID=61420 RepID=A0A5N7ACD9_9EURO|nr:uncharacterized protein BDV27DRAFT_156126 [Aspergillus caelatus]KAE8366270.1 hypothetical protein BDV27DRAFT_156126 [Aspergillus caelatus]